jgi:hypothetical protein
MTMTEGFAKDSIIIVNLVNPKEKFWGHLSTLSAAGLMMRGINLDSFEDWVRQLARGDEPNLDLVTMFVPLFRVERIFLDEPVGAVRSYSEFFEEVVQTPVRKFLGIEGIRNEIWATYHPRMNDHTLAKAFREIGRRGGLARASSLTSARRSAIAKEGSEAAVAAKAACTHPKDKRFRRDNGHEYCGQCRRKLSKRPRVEK